MEHQPGTVEIGLDDLRARLVQTDLIPSQKPLLVDIEERFALLHTSGVSSVDELRTQLRSAKSLGALAAESGVDSDYLVLLRRALVGFLPKPRALKDFHWVDQTVVVVLSDAGINNTNHFNKAAANEVTALEAEFGLQDGALSELGSLCDLCRVQWVSPKFAGALFAAGYRSAAALAAADPTTLCEETTKASERLTLYGGKVGLRDFQRVIQAAHYVNWTSDR